MRGGLMCLAFGLELAVYVSVVMWGWSLPVPLPVRVAVAGLAVALFALLWGLYAAPRAVWPLAGLPRAAFELAWFGAGAAALAATGRVVPALTGAALYAVQAAGLRSAPTALSSQPGEQARSGGGPDTNAARAAGHRPG